MATGILLPGSPHYPWPSPNVTASQSTRDDTPLKFEDRDIRNLALRNELATAFHRLAALPRPTG
ncbi:hypothetical protein [Streptomyces sp. NPDC002547]